jgi:hypothetical protein
MVAWPIKLLQPVFLPLSSRILLPNYDGLRQNGILVVLLLLEPAVDD